MLATEYKAERSMPPPPTKVWHTLLHAVIVFVCITGIGVAQIVHRRWYVVQEFKYLILTTKDEASRMMLPPPGGVW